MRRSTREPDDEEKLLRQWINFDPKNHELTTIIIINRIVMSRSMCYVTTNFSISPFKVIKSLIYKDIQKMPIFWAFWTVMKTSFLS